jgi:isoquinoline 1-oxidoreductase alpha subunit
MSYTIIVNGQAHTVDVEPDMPLLWVLRDELGLMGTKYGCGIASCGACTVQVDGEAVRTCVMPIQAVDGAQITTIEGLSDDGDLHPVQAAWIEKQVPQCGYCQSGMIMAVSALLKQNPNPSEEDVNTTISNVCRCGTYQRVRDAIDTLKQV